MFEVVNAGSAIDKTLIATQKIPVYRQPLDNAEIAGYVNGGQPAGVVFAWLNANPGIGRSNMWWSFYPVNGMYYYAPHNPAHFSLSALKQQGVISVTEKVRQEQEAKERESRAWYDNLIRDYWWIPIAGIGIMQIPGIIKATR